MKKIFILSIAIVMNFSSFAQRSFTKNAQPLNSIDPNNYLSLHADNFEKTTATGDTIRLSNIADTAKLVIYPLGTIDSGYVTGTNFWGDQAFAEQYSFNGADSSMSIIGVFAQFGGNVNPSSAKTINFNLWGQGGRQMIGANLYYNGFPDNVIDSVTVPVTKLGIGTTVDTLKKFLFPTPSKRLSGPFFVGYNINYNFFSLNGDTIGLASSGNNVRKGLAYSVEVVFPFGDTVVNVINNVQNATLESDGKWHDNYTDNDSLFNNLAIYPIVVIGTPTNVKGVTRNNFTFFGNYPNPAVNNTNIKFSLSNNASVTIQIMDMSDRIIKTMQETNLSAGEHIIPVNTSDMPAGDYLYLIRTSCGDGIASKMTKTPNP